MHENEKFEIRTETTVTFEVFKKFFNSMRSLNKVNRFFLNYSPYIFLTGVFFCLLDMIIFKEDSVGSLFLIIVLLMGGFMLALYILPPRAAYDANRKSFSLPYKYIFNEKGFSVGRTDYDENGFISYSSVRVVVESETAFYLGYQNETYFIEKSGFSEENSLLLSNVLKSENPRKYSKIKD